MPFKIYTPLQTIGLFLSSLHLSESRTLSFSVPEPENIFLPSFHNILPSSFLKRPLPPEEPANFLLPSLQIRRQDKMSMPSPLLCLFSQSPSSLRKGTFLLLFTRAFECLTP